MCYLVNARLDVVEQRVWRVELSRWMIKHADKHVTDVSPQQLIRGIVSWVSPNTLWRRCHPNVDRHIAATPPRSVAPQHHVAGIVNTLSECRDLRCVSLMWAMSTLKLDRSAVRCMWLGQSRNIHHVQQWCLQWLGCKRYKLTSSCWYASCVCFDQCLMTIDLLQYTSPLLMIAVIQKWITIRLITKLATTRGNYWYGGLWSMCVHAPLLNMTSCSTATILPKLGPTSQLWDQPTGCPVKFSSICLSSHSQASSKDLYTALRNYLILNCQSLDCYHVIHIRTILNSLHRLKKNHNLKFWTRKL